MFFLPLLWKDHVCNYFCLLNRRCCERSWSRNNKISSHVISMNFFSIPMAFDSSEMCWIVVLVVLSRGLISLFIAIIYSHTVKAFSFDSLFLPLRTSSQNLFVVKPSVARVIFLSNSFSLSSKEINSLDDNVSWIDLFDCLAIITCHRLCLFFLFQLLLDILSIPKYIYEYIHHIFTEIFGYMAYST